MVVLFGVFKRNTAFSISGTRLATGLCCISAGKFIMQQAHKVKLMHEFFPNYRQGTRSRITLGILAIAQLYVQSDLKYF